MGKLGTVAAGSEIEFKVERPVKSLTFRVDWTGQDYDDVTPKTVQEAVLFLQTKTSELNVDIKYQKKDGTFERAFANIPLIPVWELEAFGEGQIKMEGSGTAGQNDGAVTVYAELPLSKDGAIPFDDDEVLIITMPVSTGDVTIFASDHPIASETFREIGVLTMPQGYREKEFDVSNAEQILIRMGDITASTELTLFHTNGKTMTYKVEELVNLGLVSNPVSYNFNGLVYSGFGNYAILNVSTCTKLRVNRTSTALFEMYLEMDNVHHSVETAKEVNATLVQPSAGRLISQFNKIRKNRVLRG